MQGLKDNDVQKFLLSNPKWLLSSMKRVFHELPVEIIIECVKRGVHTNFIMKRDYNKSSFPN